MGADGIKGFAEGLKELVEELKGFVGRANGLLLFLLAAELGTERLFIRWL